MKKVKPIYYSIPEYNNADTSYYYEEKRRLQVTLLKVQEWVKKNNKRLAIVFEGRDAAGKGTVIRRITQNLNTKGFKIFELGVPNKSQQNRWFDTHLKAMPNKGEIVLFDRSWYSRAIIQPAMGFCSMEQYAYFMKKVNDWERGLSKGKNGFIFIKIYLSVNRENQRLRLNLRRSSELKYWKLSKNDLEALSSWHTFSFFKQEMFEKTSTKKNTWHIINSDNKFSATLISMQLIVSHLSKKSEINHIICDPDLPEIDNKGKYTIKIDEVIFDNLNRDQYELLYRIKSNE